jgi:glycosyltransferase involved in cell wall biosynthesis
MPKRVNLEPSHVFFLSTFLVPRTSEDLPTLSADEWRLCLGADAMQVTRDFVELGLLEESSLYYQLDYHHTVVELRELLRERDLSTSGTKRILIQRLLEVDYEGMRKQTLEPKLLACSGKGVEHVRDYWTSIEGGEVSALQNLNIARKKLRELRGFILGTVAGGIIGNRADALLMELIDTLREVVKTKLPESVGKPDREPSEPETSSVGRKLEARNSGVPSGSPSSPAIRRSRDYGISLVVPVHNPRHLDWVLARAAKQTRVPDEMIVVDDTSFAGVRRIASSFGAKYVRTSEGPGKRSLARQIGADRSTRSVLVYCDQDVLMAPRVVEGFEAYANAFPTNIVKPITFEFSEEDIRKGARFCNAFLDSSVFEDWKGSSLPRLKKDYSVRIKEQFRKGSSQNAAWIRSRIDTTGRWLDLVFHYEILWREYFYSIPSDCFCITHELLRRVGGWDVDYEGWGFEDLDLNFRLDRAGARFFQAVFPLFAAFHLFHRIDEKTRDREARANYRRFVSRTGWSPSFDVR